MANPKFLPEQWSFRFWSSEGDLINYSAYINCFEQTNLEPKLVREIKKFANFFCTLFFQLKFFLVVVLTSLSLVHSNTETLLLLLFLNFISPSLFLHFDLSLFSIVNRKLLPAGFVNIWNVSMALSKYFKKFICTSATFVYTIYTQIFSSTVYRKSPQQ